jgi:cysteine-rich repeat protein
VTSSATDSGNSSTGSAETSGSTGTTTSTPADTSTSIADTTETTDATGTPVCGDGEVQGDELCDDGNDMVGDGCTDCRPSLTIDWIETFGSSDVELEAAVAVVAAGNRLVVVGALGSTATDSDVWVEALDGRGVSFGRYLHDGPAHSDDVALDVRATLTGEVTIAAAVDHGAPEGLQIETTRLDPDLGVLWTNVRGTNSVVDRPSSIALVPGGVIVGGLVDGDAWLVRLDDDGNLLEERFADLTPPAAVLDLTTTTTEIRAAVLDAGLVRLWGFAVDTPLASVPTWDREMEVNDNTPVSIDISAAGDVHVCGTLVGEANDAELWIQRSDPTGDVVWTAAHDLGDGDAVCRGIRLSGPDVMLVGEIRESDSQAVGYAARAEASTGDLVDIQELVVESSVDTRVIGIDLASNVPYVVGAYAVNATDDNAFVARLVP